MRVLTCPLEGVLTLEPRIHRDERGFFSELFECNNYSAVGIKDEFIQDNISHSIKNVLRGLHFTKKKNQSQLLTILSGVVFDVVVDVRPSSNTFGRWHGVQLSADRLSQVYMPFGFAHGFCVLSETATLHYKVSQKYDPTDDCGILWSDSDIGIDWPIDNPIISPKDMGLPNIRTLYRDN